MVLCTPFHQVVEACILDTCIVNANILYNASSDKKLTQLEFRRAVAEGCWQTMRQLKIAIEHKTLTFHFASKSGLFPSQSPTTVVQTVMFAAPDAVPLQALQDTPLPLSLFGKVSHSYKWLSVTHYISGQWILHLHHTHVHTHTLNTLLTTIISTYLHMTCSSKSPPVI